MSFLLDQSATWVSKSHGLQREGGTGVFVGGGIETDTQNITAMRDCIHSQNISRLSYCYLVKQQPINIDDIYH